MKSILLKTLLFSLTLMTVQVAMSQNVTLPRTPSPAAEVSQTIGISKITINYSRPAVNGREIWGKLVHQGFQNLGFGTSKAAPWRAGANENTVITITHDAMIEGKKLAAGSYGFFVAVGEGDNATIIFSKDTGSWGSYFYDEAQDALRADIKSTETAMTERLTYGFENIDGKGGTIVLDWEKRRFPIKIEFDVPEIVYNNLKTELKSAVGFSDASWNAAASYLVQNNIHMDEALTWSENAISTPFIGVENFQNLRLKAQILAKSGETTEANAIMAKALDHPTASVNDYYNYGRFLIGSDKDKEAFAIFQKLNKKWPKNWLAPHGLARGYAALGDYKKALKFEKLALTQAPANSKPTLEGYVKKLEAGKDFN